MNIKHCGIYHNLKNESLTRQKNLKMKIGEMDKNEKWERNFPSHPKTLWQKKSLLNIIYFF